MTSLDPGTPAALPECHVKPNAGTVPSEVRSAAIAMSDCATAMVRSGAPPSWRGDQALVADHRLTQTGRRLDDAVSALRVGVAALDRYVDVVDPLRERHQHLERRHGGLTSACADLRRRATGLTAADHPELAAEAARLRGQVADLDADLAGWSRALRGRADIISSRKVDMIGITTSSRMITLGLLVAVAVSVSACMPTSSGRSDGSSAPEIADQAEYEAVRDEAERTMSRAMSLAAEASGAEASSPRVSTSGCEMQPENVREIEVVSGLRYRGSDAPAAAQAIARAWRGAGWKAEVAEQTAVGFKTDLGSGVTMGLGLSRIYDADDGDGQIWSARATSDCMELPKGLSEKIQTGDL